MQRFLKTSAVALALLSATSASAACFYDTIRASTQVEQFYDNQDGTLLDMKTGLIWAVCIYGQTFDTNTNACVGAATQVASWSAALQAQDDFDLAGHTDWRLPNVKELATIVEYACVDPAIRPELFPQTPSAPFWTHTPDSADIDPVVLGRYIDFYDGTEFNDKPEIQRYVRLVREAD